MVQRQDPLAEGDRLAREGNRAAAVDAYDAAVDGAPITARARAADVLLELGKLAEALKRAEAAWRIAPDAPEALLLMGRVAWRARAVREALACLDRIPETSPLWPDAQAERAEAMLAGRRADEAYTDVRRALNRRTDSPALWLAMGHVLMALERPEEAEDAYRETVERLPSSVRGLAGLAEVCLRLGRPEEAVEASERAVEASNGNPVARTVLAHALLAVGRHEEAWGAYEARFDAYALDHRVGVKPRSFESPMWDGSALADSAILVWGEGTPADEIYFGAMIQLVAAQDPTTLLLECDPRLADLFGRSFPDAQIVVRATPPDPELAGHFLNWQSPIGGLPHRLKAYRDDYATVPRGYLKVDDSKRERWRARWAESDETRVIGITWRHPDSDADRRSVPFSPLLDAVSAPGRVVVALQRGMSDEERTIAADRIRIEPDPDPNDADELAARAAACDVVVTIDSLVGHLSAGAGIDTRILLDAGADARWGAGRDRISWYPSARLYWQDLKGDWTRALGRMRKAVDGG
ncbi:acetolactate synthase 3 small subunit [alpha proteobacterium BAL199]|jgi:tetratricopeptide (TPR) repeat protein|nr:acetolactate synthase 3 small subunit [alpha proteobacterium BAL199]